MEIENNQECFVQLWLKLERTRRMLGMQYKRFCIRNVLKAWFGVQATDDFIWEVCHNVVVNDEQVCGNDILPPPSLYPRKHRELLRCIVAVKNGLSPRRVDLKALDAAYSIAFPHSTALNINKKKILPSAPSLASGHRHTRTTPRPTSQMYVNLQASVPTNPSAYPATSPPDGWLWVQPWPYRRTALTP